MCNLLGALYNRTMHLCMRLSHNSTQFNYYYGYMATTAKLVCKDLGHLLLSDKNHCPSVCNFCYIKFMPNSLREVNYMQINTCFVPPSLSFSYIFCPNGYSRTRYPWRYRCVHAYLASARCSAYEELMVV